MPLRLDLGRLKLGGSTYDGTWDSNGAHWFTSWGADLAYQLQELEVRGEYMQARRDAPAGGAIDRRTGWYAQGSYKLARLPLELLKRVEVVVRVAGADQPAAPVEAEQGEAAEAPGTTRERQVALGVDYWISPSVVVKGEYDRDFPIGSVDSNALQASIAVGF